jgi:hypothetical protein
MWDGPDGNHYGIDFASLCGLEGPHDRPASMEFMFHSGYAPGGSRSSKGVVASSVRRDVDELLVVRVQRYGWVFFHL